MEVFLFLIVLLAIFVGFAISRDSQSSSPFSNDSFKPDYEIPDRRSPVTHNRSDSAEALSKFTVEHVIDGDTVILSGFWSQERIRLYAIDCPEDGQPWGNIATAGLIKMIGGRSVYLEKHGIDKFGRTLGTLYVQKGSELMNVNERMVILGHAWVMRNLFHNLPLDRQEKISRMEQWARSKKVGLWKTERPIPPWLWRRQDGC